MIHSVLIRIWNVIIVVKKWKNKQILRAEGVIELIRNPCPCGARPCDLCPAGPSPATHPTPVTPASSASSVTPARHSKKPNYWKIRENMWKSDFEGRGVLPRTVCSDWKFTGKNKFPRFFSIFADFWIKWLFYKLD